MGFDQTLQCVCWDLYLNYAKFLILIGQKVIILCSSSTDGGFGYKVYTNPVIIVSVVTAHMHQYELVPCL